MEENKVLEKKSSKAPLIILLILLFLFAADGNPKAYLISDDCKTITLSTGKIGSKLTKQD